MLHISDLHFVEDITERGKRLWWRKAFGAKSHSYAKVDALSGALNSLQLEGWAPDMLLVTGDVCTDGSKEALRTGLNFIENCAVRYGSAGRLLMAGLGMASDQRVILPGNHDRYSGWKPIQDPTNINLEIVFFGAATGYPYSRGYRRPEHRSDSQSPTLLFFIFDSTSMVPNPEGNVLEGLLQQSPYYGAARGRLTPAECQWLVDESQLIAQNSKVLDLNGEEMSVDYDTAVRIAVLHHHPVNTSQGADPLNPTTLMEQYDLFVRKCLEARVDLVLFGHQHTTFACTKRENGHCTRFFCCPSASEYSAKDTGFYAFAFNEDYFTVTLYRWQEALPGALFQGSTGTSFVRNDTSPPYEYSR
jgi:3',5'-cyclic AMP phosphodiesterase CpdA